MRSRLLLSRCRSAAAAALFLDRLGRLGLPGALFLNARPERMELPLQFSQGGRRALPAATTAARAGARRRVRIFRSHEDLPNSANTV